MMSDKSFHMGSRQLTDQQTDWIFNIMIAVQKFCDVKILLLNAMTEFSLGALCLLIPSLVTDVSLVS